MKVEVGSKENREEFLAYCRVHRLEVDDSYLYDEDLMEFKEGEKNPTFVIREGGVIVAVASIILDDYHRRGNRGRFRIFHSVNQRVEDYQALFHALEPAISDLEHVIVFVSDEDPKMAEAMEALGFFVERSSCLLRRETKEIQPLPELPDGFSLQIFQPGIDESNWAGVRNQAFAKLLGSQTPLTEEQVVKMTQEDVHLPQGMMILFDRTQAIGLVRGADDEYEDQPIMDIGPLAVLPEYQGRGLGRYLLRAAISFGKQKGYGKVVLSVNAENERAKSLYLKEGFVQVEGIRCFRWNIK
jgi:mycothiol synthase